MIYIFILLLFIIISFLNGYFGPFLDNIKGNFIHSKSVSILIPARNEVNRISKCIDSLIIQDYPNFKIIVLDDESEDGTFEFLKNKYYYKIQLERGRKRPMGWLGKSWACQQLSVMSDSDILIFTDADNWYKKDAISKSVAYMEKFQLDMLSAFPQNVTTTFSENTFTPIVDRILYSLLPLWLTYKSNRTSLAAANGQWICIKKEVYQNIGGHSELRKTNVEDIALARKLKLEGFKILTLSAMNIIYVRMYNNFSEVFKGFSKNMYQMLGGNISALIFNLLLFWSPIFGLLFSNFETRISILILLIFWKLILQMKYNINIIYSIIFYPSILIFMTATAFISIFKEKKEFSWR
ncbi:glycosyltransferase [Candidatus Kapabacteria bacterium]|nr:glycosyltransferase [Candidatus Kapabacteria bacterium]